MIVKEVSERDAHHQQEDQPEIQLMAFVPFPEGIGLEEFEDTTSTTTHLYDVQNTYDFSDD